MYKKDKD